MDPFLLVFETDHFVCDKCFKSNNITSVCFKIAIIMVKILKISEIKLNI